MPISRAIAGLPINYRSGARDGTAGTEKSPSGDGVEGIWHLERAFREAALKIAQLVAHVGDDRVARRRHFLTLLSLELLNIIVIPVAARDQSGPAFVTGSIEIPERRLALTVATGGYEKYRNALVERSPEQLESRHDRGCIRPEYPFIETARSLGQSAAGPVRDEAKIVGDEVCPIGERSFVDIEDQGGFGHLTGALLDVFACAVRDRGDVILIESGLIVLQSPLHVVDVEQRGRDCRYAGGRHQTAFGGMRRDSPAGERRGHACSSQRTPQPMRKSRHGAAIVVALETVAHSLLHAATAGEHRDLLRGSPRRGARARHLRSIARI